MKKIAILVADNAYESVIHFSKGLAEAFEKLGVSTRLFWIGDDHFFHAFYAIMEDPPDFTCSFSDISLDGRPLADLWNIPHLSLLIDPPIYFLHQLTSKKGWISCVDIKDCAFVRSLDFSQVFFLPHGCDARLKKQQNHDRPYKAVFFGTCIDYEAIAKAWRPGEREILFAASEQVLSNQGISIFEALKALGVSPYDLPRFHGEVDQYTRGVDRIELIRSLKGEKVHIWGKGPWKKFFCDHPVHPPESFERSLSLMQESQLVLNSSPRFKQGTHERIFYALLCGAAVYTGENTYIREHLPEVYTYHYGSWEPPSFDRWRERVEAGQQKVLAEHTWDKRAEQILNAIQQID